MPKLKIVKEIFILENIYRNKKELWMLFQYFVKLIQLNNIWLQRNGRKTDTTTVVETLYKNKRSLEAIFKILDKDNSGNL